MVSANQGPIGIADEAIFEQHVSPPGHPERPARLKGARAGLARGAAEREILRLSPRCATLDELARAHDARYVDDLSAIVGKAGHLDADTFFSPKTHEAMLAAAGAALQVTDGLLDGRFAVGMSLARPPGHHARPSGAMGFCLLNHVAIAAHHALKRGLERVLILDWDVHHGNGTEEIFERDPRVLYVSLHQSPQYPGTGAASDTGLGEGRGYTVNVPLAAGADGVVYRAAFERLIAPIVEQFAPQLALVSAGYDAHQRDPLGGMELRAEDFGWMTWQLMQAVGPSRGLGFVLEGGYDLRGLEESVAATLRATRAVEPIRVEAPAAALGPRHQQELDKARSFQSRHWKLS